jgi:hypothetical protein
MGYTETNRQPNANTTKRIKTAKEKLERALKELKDTRVPKELNKGSNGGAWACGKGGKGAYQNRSPKGKGNWYDRNGGYDRGGRAYGSDGRGSSENRERDQQHESGSPYVPKKKMLCKVCEWAERPWHIVTNHDRGTCNHPGGDMEGYSPAECINSQRQLNEKYYEEEKRNRQPPPIGPAGQNQK